MSQTLMDVTRNIDKLDRKLERMSTAGGETNRYSAWRHAISAFMFLPGLTGLWTASQLDPSGNWDDWHANGLTLTRQGAPLLTYDGLQVYITLDGTNDYYNRADEQATSITGTETHIAAGSRGLTFGGWFIAVDDTPPTVEYYMSKMGAVGNYSYSLAHNTTGTVVCDISDDGTNFDSATSTATTDGWSFLVGRFDPSTEVAVFVNAVKAVNVAAIGASIFDGNGAFQISGWNGANNLFTGSVSIGFLCACALSDDMIGACFQQTRALYGV